MKRKNTSKPTEAEVMFRSDRQCCVCNKRGDQIHHIDGNPPNSDFNNLVFLCFDCHNEATIKHSLRKKLSPQLIRKYRDEKYKVVEQQRANSLKVFDSRIKELTTEDLLTTTKNALIILELEKIKEEYYSASWEKRLDVIGKLSIYSNHTNYRIAYEIFDFLELAADQTRAGMTNENSSSIFTLILNFFPNTESKSQDDKLIELANQCINIAFSLVYDSIIYLNNFNVAMDGLLLLKYIYKKGKRQKIQELIDLVKNSYAEIEQTLQRPERNDLNNALELVRIFKADIKEDSLAYPPLPNHLINLNQKS